MRSDGQPNAMGGREVGGLSNLLPAHRDLQNQQHRAEVEQFWNIMPGKIAAQPGLTATEMFDALNEGKLKAIWVLCTNPLISLPDVRKAEAALQKAKFVVVQEISHQSEMIKYADVVLPAAAWAEKEGTMTNDERRIGYLHKIKEAPARRYLMPRSFAVLHRKWDTKDLIIPMPPPSLPNMLH